MDRETWKSRYEAAKRSDDFDVHADFIDALLEERDREAIELHYELLRDRANRDLYLDLRAAFVKRGAAAVGHFLVEKARAEPDAAMRADILHLLGLLDHPLALQLAREAVTSADPDVRNRGAYVLGWLGESEDIARLREVLLHDPNPSVRSTAASAHSQFYEHAKRKKPALLGNLYQALEHEKELSVTGYIVVAVQDVVKKKFGVEWDSEEDELRGDVPAARDKCSSALRKMLGTKA